MADEPKFCKDCKHFIAYSYLDRCNAPAARQKVSGAPGFAHLERGYELKSTCGSAAKWFEPVPPAVPRPPRWWEFWK
jgi:hypothetical protein